MNVLDSLKKENITFTLEYYGLNDLATGWEVKSLIEKNPFFEELYSKHIAPIYLDYDEFLFYLISKKICCMKEIIPLIEDEKQKNMIQNIVLCSESYVKEISVGDIIKYINIDYCTIFGEEADIDAKHIALDLVAKYSGGISDVVLDFIVEKYGYLLIDNFSKFEKVFDEKPWLFERTIAGGSSNEVMMYRYDTILKVFEHILNKNKSSLGEIVENRVDSLYEEMVSLAEKLDDESMMREEHKIRLFCSFLERVKHVKAPEFAIVNRNVEKELT